MAVLNHRDQRIELTDAQEQALVAHGLVSPHVDEDGVEVPDEYGIDEALLKAWPELTAAETMALLRYQALTERRGPLDETEALDLINYALSAPEWNTSMLEDLAAIVRRTNRTEVPGASWPRH